MKTLSLTLTFTIALTQTVLAEPPLEEFAGGAIPDDARAALRDAFFEEIPLLGEPSLSPRPSGIAKMKMDAVAAKFPQLAAAQRYLGRACYATGDVTCAERAYKSAIDLSSSASWALLSLADFYAQRNQPKDELAALDRLADAQKADAKATTDGKSTLRATYERARDTAASHQVAGIDPARYERAIVELYPDDPSYLRRYVDGLLAAEKPAAALAEVTRYKKTFPLEARYFAQVESQVAENRRDADKAEGVYRAIFAKSPMPSSMSTHDADGLYDDYLDLLRRQGHEREVKRALAAKARKGLIDGRDLALLVHLHVHNGDRDQAKKVLDTAAGTPGSPTELLLRARLYRSLAAPADAIPILYEAFRKASAKDPARVEALGELGLALTEGDVGRTGLTPLGPLDGFRLRHVASGPSVAGGLASLVFNGVRASSTADLERVEAAYGNGARAGAVLSELKKSAPKSKQTAALTRALVDFRRAYHDDADAIRLADDFTRAFPKDPRRFFDVARDSCDSRWRALSQSAGHACYVRFLDEASRRGDSREYYATLQALASALERDKRQVEIVRLFWNELGKRPSDSALYDRFLEHLGRHNLFDEELKVYQEGAKRFATTAWYDRLARWHLRHKGKQAFRDLTEQLLGSIDDAIAVEYLETQVTFSRDDSGSLAFYEAMYRHALDRFPLDERFAKKLIAFYDRDGGSAQAAEKLVKRFSFFDGDLRARLLRGLATDGKLDGATAQLQKGKSPVERQLAASALVFSSRQEEAEPTLAALAADFPGDVPLAKRHAALWRALARPSPRAAAVQAAGMLDGLTKLYPADEALVTEAGDYLSEAGQFDDATRRYEKIVVMRPSDPGAYLRLASIDWDYFHFDAAAEAIGRARKRSGDPLKFADKLAAVYESKKDYGKAIDEYVRIVIGAQKLDAHTRTPLSDEQRGGEGEYGDEGEGYRADYNEGGNDNTIGAAAALSRLDHLAKRKKMGAVVEKAWKAPLASGDGRAVLGYAAWLASAGQDEARLTFLAASAKKSGDPRLLERIANDARGVAEARAVLVAALAREAELGKGAPSYVYPLCDALGEAKRDAEAEAQLKALAERLDAGGLGSPPQDGVGRDDDREEAVAARVAFADFYWQRARADEAIAQRSAAADRATGERKTDLTLEVINWRLAKGQLAEAEKAARPLLDANPGVPRFVQPVAEALWRRGEKESVIQLYQAQLPLARAKAGLTDEAKRALVAELRRALAARYGELDRHREAVDQMCEIVNRRPDDKNEILGLFDYAQAHALVPRITTYYKKAAKDSPKDHRWPVVLATFADAAGDPKGAADRLAESLAVAPDRVDLATWRAEALARAGDAIGSAAAYHRLWEMSDHDPRWAAQEATMLARGGKRTEALAAVGRLVESDPAEPGPWVRAAQLLERAGLIDEALSMSAKSIDKVRKDLRTQVLSRDDAATYARLAVRAGQATAGWKALLALEDKAHTEAGVEGNAEPWRASSTSDACHDAAEDALPKAVAEFAGDGDAKKFADAVRDRARGDRIESMARVALVAGRPDLEREIYRRAAAGGGREGDRFAEMLLANLEAAHQFSAVVQWVDQAHLATERDLLAQARACRLLGDACEERALKVYADKSRHGWGDPLQWRFGERDPHLDRYLEILLARKREPELAALAQRGTYHAGQIADFLFAHGRADLGAQAIDAAGRPESTAWRSAKQATALLALGGNGPKARDLLATILAPAPIGSALGKHPDQDKQVMSRRWFRYAERYGDALAQSGQLPEARRFYAAPVEDRPLDPAAYLEQGDAFERAQDHGRAQSAYEHALDLKSGHPRAIDHLAKSFLAAGDKKRALATWDRLLVGKTPSEAAHRSRFDLVLAAGLAGEARSAYGAHLDAGWQKRVDRGQAIADLQALGKAYPSRGAGSEWEKFLRKLLDRSGWKDLSLLAAMAGRAGDPLLDGPAREPYLRMGLNRASDEEKPAWRQALADWGLAERHFDATLDAVDQAVHLTGPSSAEPAGGTPRSLRSLADAAPAQAVAQWMAIDRARARAGKGDAARAATELLAWTRLPSTGEGDKIVAADLLGELKQPAEWEVRLDVYRARATRDHGAADDVGLADALLHTGKRDEAIALLRRAVVRRLDDDEAYRLAAELAEKSKLTDLARELRNRLAALRPRDGENQLALARDERDAGATDRAVKLAAALLADRASDVASRRGAGLLLGDLSRARAAGASDALDAARGSDEPTALARARAADDPGPLASALADLAAPRAALAELARAAAKRGRHAEAATHLARLRALGPLDGDLARLQFTEERAAGHPGAALAALPDDADDRFATASERARAGELTDGEIASAIEPARRDLGKLAADEARRIAESAAGAAADAGDRARLVYYAALADAVAPSDANKRRFRAARSAFDGARKLAARRFITANLDDLTVASAMPGGVK